MQKKSRVSVHGTPTDLQESRHVGGLAGVHPLGELNRKLHVVLRGTGLMTAGKKNGKQQQQQQRPGKACGTSQVTKQVPREIMKNYKKSQHKKKKKQVRANAGKTTRQAPADAVVREAGHRGGYASQPGTLAVSCRCCYTESPSPASGSTSWGTESAAPIYRSEISAPTKSRPRASHVWTAWYVRHTPIEHT